MSKQVTTPEFRVSFPKLFTPEEYGGKMQYSAELLFAPGTDLSDLKAAAGEAAMEYFKGNIPQGLVSPFKNGDEFNAQRVRDGKTELEAYRGVTFLRVNSFNLPRVVDQNVEDIPAMNADKVYAGSYGFAQLGAAGWTYQGRNGVKFYLNMYQFARDGERLDSREDVKDVFNRIPGAANGATDPSTQSTGSDAGAGGLFD